MKDLGSCVGPISGEHIISDAVIRVLMADGDFSIAGLGAWRDENSTAAKPSSELSLHQT
ncbi:hypothetical protein [Bradyrhizobium sp. JR4.1]|uniref:hypothetical protein n=1 Tax=Bradyrhizobium sp. JR4.1 TaxID=3156372 RepID=UPI003396A66D